MTRDQQMAELAQLAEELCDPHQHTEVVPGGWDRNRNRRPPIRHVTVQDGLLKQLRDVAHLGLKVADPTRGGGKPASKPPGHFEALNRHVFITVEVMRWCDQQKVELRRSAEENIHALLGRCPAMDDVTLARLVKEFRWWRAQAATATGWEELPYCPPVPCPVCSRFATIRVNAENRSAYCANQDRNLFGDLLCGAAWAPGCLDPLVAYVRQVTEQIAA